MSFLWTKIYFHNLSVKRSNFKFLAKSKPHLLSVQTVDKLIFLDIFPVPSLLKRKQSAIIGDYVSQVEMNDQNKNIAWLLKK